LAKMIFNGVSIRHIDGRMKDGIIFSRLHLTAELTRPIAEERGWEAGLDTDGWSSMQLTSEPIRVTSIVMKPAMLKQELKIKVEELRDFAAFRVTTEAGAVKVELRFMLISTEFAGEIFAFWAAVGDAECRLDANLQGEAQEKLALTK